MPRAIVSQMIEKITVEKQDYLSLMKEFFG